jgi:hypothetical protein
MNHQILSPYTAFVGVETTGPKINNTHSKIRHIPIQISKGDEHLVSSQPLLYSNYHSGFGFGSMPLSMPSYAPQMAMSYISGRMPPMANRFQASGPRFGL